MTFEIDLSGRNAFVTGASRGIGRASAEVLARAGANVILGYRTSEQEATETATQIEASYGVQAMAVSCDSADPEQIRAAYKQIRDRFKTLDVLVNNAGILEDALIGMISDDVVNRTLAVNTAGPIHHLQAAARLMRKSESASIINLASIIGRVGNTGQVVYSASKAAVIGFTYSASKELAPQGIRVNAIAPGFIDTDMTRSLEQDKYDERVASVKMGRAGTAEDVADTVLFLASDLSTYVTGQVIGVDGGMLV